MNGEITGVSDYELANIRDAQIATIHHFDITFAHDASLVACVGPEDRHGRLWVIHGRVEGEHQARPRRDPSFWGVRCGRAGH